MKVSREDAFHLYRCILGHEPKNEQVMDQLMELDFDTARARLLESDKAMSVSGSSLSESKWKESACPEDVLFFYETLLKRLPENEKVISEKMELGSLESVLDNFLDSEEFFEKKYRAYLSGRIEKTNLNGLKKSSRRHGLLLIGAYGNGNVGDSDQPQFLAKYLLDMGLTNEQLFSVSWESVSNYAFDGKKLPRECLFDFEMLSSFKAILIGGGGLLGVEHYPLTDIRWIEGLIATGTPYFLMAIGASREHANDPFYHNAYAALLEGCQGVSVRDNESALALSRFRSGVLKLCDPVIMRCIDEAEVALITCKRLDVVLRYPLDEQQWQFINGLKDIYSDIGREELRVIFIEPFSPLEADLISYFPDCIVCYSIEDLCTVVQGSTALLSMRLHGCVPAIKYGVPVVGFGPKKIKELFDELELPQVYWPADVTALLGFIKNKAWLDLEATLISPEVVLRLSGQYSQMTRLLKSTLLGGRSERSVQ